MIGMHSFHFWAEYREYAQVKLLDSLIQDDCYYVEFYTKPDTYSPYLINNIAANFSANSYSSVNYTTALQVPMHVTRFGNPILTDTTRWSQINGIYKANGGEKYITLGNFNTCANTNSILIHPNSGFAQMSYYFFDSVSVIKIVANSPLLWQYQNPVIKKGDSVYIGNYLGGSASVQWYEISGSLVGYGPGVTVKPDSTTKYEVRVGICGMIFRDTVLVTVLDPIITGRSKFSKLPSGSFVLYPTPAKNTLHLKFEAKEKFEMPCLAEITDFTGSALISQKLLWSQYRCEIDISKLPSGVYFLILSTGKGERNVKQFTVEK